MKQLSRRDFLKHAGVGAAAAAAFGSLAGCATAGAVPESTIAWDYETDVVVMGFGIAGVGASCQAADLGAEVILLEKAPAEYAGGSSTCNGGYIVPTPLYTSDVEAYYRAYRARYPRQIIQARMDATKMLDQWMADNPIDGIIYLEEGAFAGAYMHQSGGRMIYPSLVAAVERRPNITVMYETPGMELIQDPETKEILGVIVTKDGASINIKARKGVIFATGSYTSNRELLKQFNHSGIFIPCNDSPYNTGDAIWMSTEVGAQLWGFSLESLEWGDWGFRLASEAAGTAVTFKNLPPAENSAFIMVNQYGKRFMNEYRTIQHAHDILEAVAWDHAKNEYTNNPFWMVLDSTMFDSYRLGEWGAEEECWIDLWNGVFGVYQWSEDNSVELEKGWIVQADSIENLATKMTAKDFCDEDVSCVSAGLAATIAAYNQGCAAGVDPDFGRPTDRLRAIGTPPFYAIEMCPTVLYGAGGPKADGSCCVVNRHDEPIPRLYAAGQVCYKASGLINALSMGYLAATNACALENWDAEV